MGSSPTVGVATLPALWPMYWVRMIPVLETSLYWSGLAINSDIKNSWLVALLESACRPPLIKRLLTLSERETDVVLV